MSLRSCQCLDECPYCANVTKKSTPQIITAAKCGSYSSGAWRECTWLLAQFPLMRAGQSLHCVKCKYRARNVRLRCGCAELCYACCETCAICPTCGKSLEEGYDNLSTTDVASSSAPTCGLVRMERGAVKWDIKTRGWLGFLRVCLIV